MVKRRNQIGEQFAYRVTRMLESPAYRALSMSAHRMMSRIEIELGHHGGNDNGKLPVTFSNFVQYGIDRHAVAPAMRELVALGFLEITHRGRAGNGEFRAPNLFRLTYRHDQSRLKPSDDWAQIATIEQANAFAAAARKNKSPVREKPRFGAGSTHRKRKSPVRENPTTGKVRKPPLLSISRGGDHD